MSSSWMRALSSRNASLRSACTREARLVGAGPASAAEGFVSTGVGAGLGLAAGGGALGTTPEGDPDLASLTCWRIDMLFSLDAVRLTTPLPVFELADA